MKPLALSIAFIAIVLNCWAQKSGDNASLMVAISNYEPGSGWTHIHSNNDVPLVKNALAQQGFDTTATSLELLTDAKATHQGILEGLERLAKRAKSGGMAYFHFSGHGQQIMDQNGDEPDGYDEALVPYDAHAIYEKGVYEGEKHFRDDELRAAFNKIRKTLGPKGQLLVVMDACHSGTASRGELFQNVRGTAGKMAPEGYRPSNNLANDQNNMDEDESPELAPMVSFYACSPSELNYEYKGKNQTPVGPLSLAFSRAFSNVDKNASYQQLFNAVRAEMSEIAMKQAPQAEGNLDYTLMGGKLKGGQKYYAVLEAKDNKLVKINAGLMAGLHPGTVLKFYDFGTTDTTGKVPRAVGEILESTMLTAYIKLQPNEVSPVILRKCPAFVSARNFGDLGVRLRVNLPEGILKKALLDTIATVPAVQVVGKDFDLLLELDAEGQVVLSTREEMVLAGKAEKEKLDVNDPLRCAGNLLEEYILGYAQGAYLRKIKGDRENMSFKLEILPVEVNELKRFKSFCKDSTFAQKDGRLIVREGQNWVFKVTNTGKQDAYFTIVDIQPNNIVHLLIPYPTDKLKPADYFLAAGDSIAITRFPFCMEPPFGIETVKLIADDEPIDLSPIAANRGLSKGLGDRALNPFEKLFERSYNRGKSGSRGPVTSSMPPDEVSIETVVFENRGKGR